VIAHPLLDIGVWAAVADAAPRSGFRAPDAALAAVAGHVLPTEVVSRRTKAGFDALFFGEHSRALAREWDGGDIPAELVEASALRAHWLGDAPDPHSLTLLQTVWLASAGDRVQQPLGRAGQ
jgi:asparagine synthase (glutamine-hydrolysing)